MGSQPARGDVFVVGGGGHVAHVPRIYENKSLYTPVISSEQISYFDENIPAISYKHSGNLNQKVGGLATCTWRCICC